MTSERWQLVEKIFNTVIELPPGERLSYLQQTCGHDAELLREIELLIEKDDSSNIAIESLIGRQAAYFSGESSEDLPHYRSRSTFGAGLAAQELMT